MPDSMQSLVTAAIDNHMNLNVLDHVTRFDGPIRLIRRSHDEIITTLRYNSMEHRLPSFLFRKNVPE
jgi:hypothetical protein